MPSTYPTPGSRPLAGRVALVTGASRGIGKGIALELAAAGATVYFTGRTVEPLKDLPGTIGGTLDDIRALGGTGVAVRCDHGVDSDVDALFERIVAEHGRLDLLVNNATAMEDYTVSIGRPFWELPIDAWEHTMKVGLRSHFVASQRAVPIMLRQGGGMIVNVSSIGSQEYLLSVPYGACKAAVHKLSADTAIELAPHGIPVISIWPGFVLTEPVLANAQTMPDGHKDFFGLDLRNAETARFSGRAVVALATDPNPMRHSGQALIVAQMAHDYGFTDLDGNLPPVQRNTADVFEGLKEIPGLYMGLYAAPLAAGRVASANLGVKLPT